MGPCLYVSAAPIKLDTNIHLHIYRGGQEMYNGWAPISRMKRSPTELVAYLYKALDFADGCFLMTGTCLVPPNSFTLSEGDIVEISIDNIGTLINTVGLK